MFIEMICIFLNSDWKGQQTCPYQTWPNISNNNKELKKLTKHLFVHIKMISKNKLIFMHMS